MAFRQRMPKHDAEQGAAEYHRENQQRDQQVIHGYLRPFGQSGSGGNYRSVREHRSSIVNQALETMGRHIQGGVIDLGLITAGGSSPLRSENNVDLFLDIR